MAYHKQYSLSSRLCREEKVISLIYCISVQFCGKTTIYIPAEIGA